MYSLFKESVRRTISFYDTEQPCPHQLHRRATPLIPIARCSWIDTFRRGARSDFSCSEELRGQANCQTTGCGR